MIKSIFCAVTLFTCINAQVQAAEEQHYIAHIGCLVELGNEQMNLPFQACFDNVNIDTRERQGSYWSPWLYPEDYDWVRIIQDYTVLAIDLPRNFQLSITNDPSSDAILDMKIFDRNGTLVYHDQKSHGAISVKN